MFKEPKAMSEIHQIMENLSEADKHKSDEEVLNRIHQSAAELIKEKGLKLEIIRKEAFVSV